jgi:hypothetical protein
VQGRLKDLVRQRVDAMRADPASAENCSLQFDIDDAVFDVPDEPYNI